VVFCQDHASVEVYYHFFSYNYLPIHMVGAGTIFNEEVPLVPEREEGTIGCKCMAVTDNNAHLNGLTKDMREGGV